ncbi:hypothetical protein H9P43_003597 [Blastocladiella emersonii ATCC 22665]|nr:hypothetical protein H9P43_003597 [Blastocladiella emersonii ATCC 22665]
MSGSGPYYPPRHEAASLRSALSAHSPTSAAHSPTHSSSPLLARSFGSRASSSDRIGSDGSSGGADGVRTNSFQDVAGSSDPRSSSASASHHEPLPPPLHEPHRTASLQSDSMPGPISPPPAPAAWTASPYHANNSSGLSSPRVTPPRSSGPSSPSSPNQEHADPPSPVMAPTAAAAATSMPASLPSPRLNRERIPARGLLSPTTPVDSPVTANSMSSNGSGGGSSGGVPLNDLQSPAIASPGLSIRKNLLVAGFAELSNRQHRVSFPSPRAIAVLKDRVLFIIPLRQDHRLSPAASTRKALTGDSLALHPHRNLLATCSDTALQAFDLDNRFKLLGVSLTAPPIYYRWLSELTLVVAAADAVWTISVPPTPGASDPAPVPIFDLFEDIAESGIVHIDVDDEIEPKWMLVIGRASPSGGGAAAMHQLYSVEKDGSQPIKGDTACLHRNRDGLFLYLVARRPTQLVFTVVPIRESVAHPNAKLMRVPLPLPIDDVVVRMVIVSDHTLVLLTHRGQVLVIDHLEVAVQRQALPAGVEPVAVASVPNLGQVCLIDSRGVVLTLDYTPTARLNGGSSGPPASSLGSVAAAGTTTDHSPSTAAPATAAAPGATSLQRTLSGSGSDGSGAGFPSAARSAGTASGDDHHRFSTVSSPPPQSPTDGAPSTGVPDDRASIAQSIGTAAGGGTGRPASSAPPASVILPDPPRPITSELEFLRRMLANGEFDEAAYFAMKMGNYEFPTVQTALRALGTDHQVSTLAFLCALAAHRTLDAPESTALATAALELNRVETLAAMLTPGYMGRPGSTSSAGSGGIKASSRPMSPHADANSGVVVAGKLTLSEPLGDVLSFLDSLAPHALLAYRATGTHHKAVRLLANQGQFDELLAYVRATGHRPADMSTLSRLLGADRELRRSRAAAATAAAAAAAAASEAEADGAIESPAGQLAAPADPTTVEAPRALEYALSMAQTQSSDTSFLQHMADLLLARAGPRSAAAFLTATVIDQEKFGPLQTTLIRLLGAQDPDKMVTALRTYSFFDPKVAMELCVAKDRYRAAFQYSRVPHGPRVMERVFLRLLARASPAAWAEAMVELGPELTEQQPPAPAMTSGSPSVKTLQLDEATIAAITGATPGGVRTTVAVGSGNTPAPVNPHPPRAVDDYFANMLETLFPETPLVKLVVPAASSSSPPSDGSKGTFGGSTASSSSKDASSSADSTAASTVTLSQPPGSTSAAPTVVLACTPDSEPVSLLWREIMKIAETWTPAAAAGGTGSSYASIYHQPPPLTPLTPITPSASSASLSVSLTGGGDTGSVGGSRPATPTTPGATTPPSGGDGVPAVPPIPADAASRAAAAAAAITVEDKPGEIADDEEGTDSAPEPPPAPPALQPLTVMVEALMRGERLALVYRVLRSAIAARVLESSSAMVTLLFLVSMLLGDTEEMALLLTHPKLVARADVYAVSRSAILLGYPEHAYNLLLAHGAYEEASLVLVDELRDLERAFELANLVDDPAVWRVVGKAVSDMLEVSALLRHVVHTFGQIDAAKAARIMGALVQLPCGSVIGALSA